MPSYPDDDYCLSGGPRLHIDLVDQLALFDYTHGNPCISTICIISPL